MISQIHAFPVTRYGGLVHDASHGLPRGPATRIRLRKRIRNRRRRLRTGLRSRYVCMVPTCFYFVYEKSSNEEFIELYAFPTFMKCYNYVLFNKTILLLYDCVSHV